MCQQELRHRRKLSLEVVADSSSSLSNSNLCFFNCIIFQIITTYNFSSFFQRAGQDDPQAAGTTCTVRERSGLQCTGPWNLSDHRNWNIVLNRWSSIWIFVISRFHRDRFIKFQKSLAVRRQCAVMDPRSHHERFYVWKTNLWFFFSNTIMSIIVIWDWIVLLPHICINWLAFRLHTMIWNPQSWEDFSENQIPQINIL